MNVFVLCTGRCGSVTFGKACAHIANFTSSHESLYHEVPEKRLHYPENHIEIDNRLSWFLGKLDKKFGNRAFYVHLIRDQKKTAESFRLRWGAGNSIITSYFKGILPAPANPMQICLDYCETVNSNIELFLKDKPQKMTIHLESIQSGFREFWEKIGAKGNLKDALAELAHHYNSSNRSADKVPSGSHPPNKKFQDFPRSSSKALHDGLTDLSTLPSKPVSVTIEGKNGRYPVMIPKAELFRIKEIFKDQGYAFPKPHRLKRPLTVFDVGANVGLFSIYVKMVDPKSTVYCFEPVSTTFGLLKKNLEKLMRINQFPFGLYNQDTTADIHIHGANTGQNSVKNCNAGFVGNETINLKDAGRTYDRLGLSRLDVLKIDTEGCEVEILESLGPRLKNIDYILLEYHSESDRRDIDDILADFTVFQGKSEFVGSGVAKYMNNRLLSANN